MNWKRPSSYKSFEFKETDRDPQIVIWILRVLVQLGTLRKFVETDGFEDLELARYVGIDHLQSYSGSFDVSATRQRIVALHSQIEASQARSSVQRPLYANLNRLSLLLGLSSTDACVLEFAVALDAVPALRRATQYLGETSFTRLIRCLEIILKIDEAALRRALRPDSVLAKSGLVTLNRSRYSIPDSIDLLSDRFAERVMTEELEPTELIRDIVYRASPSSLTLSDYTHVGDFIEILCPYLRQAIDNRQAGVNVYLYGPPGTGKTELAKLLAREISCDLYEVTYEDRNAGIANSGERIKAYGAAQNFFAQRQVIILFDEVESIFEGDTRSGAGSNPMERKAWLNRTLETNPIPAIWISNSARIDGAFLRRFDAVYEIPVPPKAQRIEIIGKACGGLLNNEAIRRIAEPEVLAPALIARSSAVIKAIKDQVDAETLSDALETLINSRLQARGHRLLTKSDSNSAYDFDLSLINADVDVQALTESLRHAKEGRICLYGPSGTGKTAVAHWLANQCGMPLMVKRGSDLVSPFVGQTERNIAEAFSEASATSSVLLIDEFDCFLQDRREAHHSWEITLVSEMLVQVEAYRGIFIATTNRLNSMDPAILRRFDAKVEFGCLTPQQIRFLFDQHCQLLDLSEPSSTIVKELPQLIGATVGDFAVVRRQSRLNKLRSPEMLLLTLRKECEFRNGKRQPIGFLH
jgi:transitional endoplasmic reticulum ATPase